MPEIPRTKFNSPWTVAVIEAALNDVASAKGSSESLTAALNAMRAEINSLSGGVHLKGAVDYYNNLPASPSEGDAYTVRYQGTSGTDPLGIEYAWATYQGTHQWIPIGVDPSVFAKQSEMNVVANAGAKNILNFTNYIVTGDTSISVTDSGGIISVSGTPSQNTFITVLNVSFSDEIPMILSGCPLNSNAMLLLRLLDDTVIAMDEGEGAEFTPSRNVSYKAVIRLVASTAYDLTFKPMIRPAAITDPTFQPYARTNPELTVLTGEDRAALVELIDNGAKNRWKITIPSTLPTGFTATVDTDGGLILNGTTGNSVLTFATSTQFHAGETVVLSGCPAGGSDDSYRIDIMRGANSSYCYGDPVIATGFTETTYPVRIRIAANYTCNNLKFFPMVCTLASWKISQAYQPYRPSWQEMYDMILALQSGGNRALTMQTEPKEEER